MRYTNPRLLYFTLRGRGRSLQVKLCDPYLSAFGVSHAIKAVYKTMLLLHKQFLLIKENSYHCFVTKRIKCDICCVDGVVAGLHVNSYQTCGADRCVLSTGTGAATARAIIRSSGSSDVNSSTTAVARRSRQLRRFDSLPANVTAYGNFGKHGHVILSSARLLEKLTATLNALTVDCRQPGARNHGNGVAVTSERYYTTNAANMRDTAEARTGNPATYYCSSDAKPEILNVVRHNDSSEDVVASNQTTNTEVESLTWLESLAPLPDITVGESLTVCTVRTHQQYADDRQVSDGGGVTATIDVILHKGPLGLGFCIDGGLDAPEGPAPITVKRLFKGICRPISKVCCNVLDF